MAANVRTMLHQALDAFARLDPIQAAAWCAATRKSTRNGRARCVT